MKLNNKGFAITSILYGLLIVFVLMVSSYLIVLNTKKKNLDTITQEIENDYFNQETTTQEDTTDSSSETYTVTINVADSEEATGTVSNGQDITFAGVETNGWTNICCDNNQEATLNGTTVTVSNVTSNTTCNITKNTSC